MWCRTRDSLSHVSQRSDSSQNRGVFEFFPLFYILIVVIILKYLTLWRTITRFTTHFSAVFKFADSNSFSLISDEKLFQLRIRLIELNSGLKISSPVQIVKIMKKSLWSEFSWNFSFHLRSRKIFAILSGKMKFILSRVITVAQ